MNKLIVIILLCSILGCNDINSWKVILPPGATNIKILDMRNAEFDLKNRRYLYHIYNHSSTITEISGENNE